MTTEDLQSPEDDAARERAREEWRNLVMKNTETAFHRLIAVPKEVTLQDLWLFTEALPRALQVFRSKEEEIGRAFPTERVKPPAAKVQSGSMLAEVKRRVGSFDLLLCHNDEDTPAVRAVEEGLEALGVLAWLDTPDIGPPLHLPSELDQRIAATKSAAVVVGKSGRGPWKVERKRHLLHRVVERETAPIISVLLPSCPHVPTPPDFLRNRTCLDLRKHVDDPNLQAGKVIEAISEERVKCLPSLLFGGEPNGPKPYAEKSVLLEQALDGFVKSVTADCVDIEFEGAHGGEVRRFSTSQLNLDQPLEAHDPVRVYSKMLRLESGPDTTLTAEELDRFQKEYEREKSIRETAQRLKRK